MQVCNLGQRASVKSQRVGDLSRVQLQVVCDGWVDADQLSCSERLKKYRPQVTQNISLGQFVFLFFFFFYSMAINSVAYG